MIFRSINGTAMNVSFWKHAPLAYLHIITFSFRRKTVTLPVILTLKLHWRNS
jgi:hypothetical protein